MAAIVQQTSDVITVLDADLVVRHQTASAGRFLRYEAGSLTGRRLLDLVHPDDLACAEAFFADLAGQAGFRPETEFRFRSGDGTWVSIEALGNNLLQDPRVHGIVVTIRDVTKRKALEEGLRLQVNELTELDRIKSDLVSTVSHELRTPLTTLVGHVEMLSDGDFGELSEDQQWAVQAIDRNSQRLLSLIEDMLTLAKIENGGLGLAVAPTDVRDLFAEIEASAAPLARAKSIDLGLEISAGVPAVLADRSALERAIMNLVSNAVKFTPEGGTVRLRASRDRANAVFAVSDTGMGMSAEDKDRLFTRFFRSPAAMSMAIPGTGLGLAIVKKIIDDHGGAIHVESVPGAGTTIEFTIPLSPPVPRAGAIRALRGKREEATAALA
jgi:PAS domain S-box-containing protein